MAIKNIRRYFDPGYVRWACMGLVLVGLAAIVTIANATIANATIANAQLGNGSASVLSPPVQSETTPTQETSKDENRKGSSTTVKEARARAKILHESFHGALQVVHRDFFRKDESTSIPSKSMEDVFKELKKEHGISLRWISVDLEPMNVDNEPETPFEKRAAAKLKAGAKSFEAVEEHEFQFAARIKLSATCLSCHAPRRKNNNDRFAGLVIRIPVNKANK